MCASCFRNSRIQITDALFITYQSSNIDGRFYNEAVSKQCAPSRGYTSRFERRRSRAQIVTARPLLDINQLI